MLFPATTSEAFSWITPDFDDLIEDTDSYNSYNILTDDAQLPFTPEQVLYITYVEFITLSY